MTLISTFFKYLPTSKIALVVTGSISGQTALIPQVIIWLQENLNSTVIYDEQNILKPSSAVDRAAIFMRYVQDDDIHTIIALRGGEGSADIIPYLQAEAEVIKSSQPKRLLGFSDFTAILLYFSQTYGWPAIHGPGGLRFIASNTDPETLAIIKGLLLGERVSNKILLTPLNAQAEVQQTLCAQVTGGNLSLLNISIKDSWEIDCRGKIVIIEDVGEKAHVVGRTLKYLQRIGILPTAQAIILGDFTSTPVGCSEAEQINNAGSIERTLQFFAKNIASVPVFSTKAVGHGACNQPFALNLEAKLTGGKNAFLEIW